MAWEKVIFPVVLFALLSLLIGIVLFFAKAHFYTASDVFWYGALAGFLGGLLLVFLALMAFLVYRLKTR